MLKKILIAALVAAISYSAYYGYSSSKAYWNMAMENLKATAQTSRN